MIQHSAAVLLPDVHSLILTLRDQKVLLDADLALVYDVPTRVLNQALKRNLDRFPADFAFQLTSDETAGIRSQPVIASRRSRFVTASRRNLRYRPWAFAELHRSPSGRPGMFRSCAPTGRDGIAQGNALGIRNQSIHQP